ncbi:aldehyde dehydrogenase family protein [Burkholderia lata]|uniref:aldehyde dehydrogenase family protein n=1 Tax=Burkholderia lata (strain ATCC 17760 / DSM 23089 / LMG 22485 / NCIMB 9086 / R18194 / 383) TaxID=482957 RepID=UPI0020C73A0F|nr:aldehyde dehydrogenase family protein [Burkholderia lata]
MGIDGHALRRHPLPPEARIMTAMRQWRRVAVRPGTRTGQGHKPPDTASHVAVHRDQTMLDQMRIARDEIVGPVAALIPFDGEDEAIAIANDTPYGLTTGLWTRDVGRAHRVSKRIDAGMVWVNTYSFLRWSTPYGGFKASGWGRENGIDALEPYLETRTTVISTTGQFPNLYAD